MTGTFVGARICFELKNIYYYYTRAAQRIIEAERRGSYQSQSPSTVASEIFLRSNDPENEETEPLAPEEEVSQERDPSHECYDEDGDKYKDTKL